MDTASPHYRIILARPRGFCAGVDRAIKIVNHAIERHGAPVYVRHEIVHNGHVLETLRARGAVFVDDTDDIPDDAVAIFSAHGVSLQVENDAKARGLSIIDATCPLVTRVHNEGRHLAEAGYEIILIGHVGHPEIEGTLGRIPGGASLVTCVEDVAEVRVNDPDKIAYITQTTLSVEDTRTIVEALRARFPAIQGAGVNDICYATQNRQTAAWKLAEMVDLLLVVGAQNSSNSRRLSEIGEQAGIPSRLIDGASMLDVAWLDGVTRIGITAGASAPDILVDELLERLRTLLSVRGQVSVEEMDGIEENVHFNLPAELRPR